MCFLQLFQSFEISIKFRDFLKIVIFHCDGPYCHALFRNFEAKYIQTGSNRGKTPFYKRVLVLNLTSFHPQYSPSSKKDQNHSTLISSTRMDTIGTNILMALVTDVVMAAVTQ
jgi:hypothetical protein